MAFNAGAIVAEVKADTKKYETGIDAAKQKTQSFDPAVGKLSGSVTKLTGAFAGFFAVSKITQELREAVSASNKLETSLLGLSAISNATGNEFDAVKAKARALADDGLITITESSQALLNILPRFNGDLEMASKVVERLKDSASVARQGTLSMGEAVVGATSGLKNLNSVMVDNAGVTKNISVIMREAGFEMQDLDDNAKKTEATMALYNGLIRETDVFQGLAAQSAETFAGKQAQLEAATFNLKAMLGDALKPALIAIVEELTNSTNNALNNKAAFDTLARATLVATKFGIAFFKVMGFAAKTVAVGAAQAANFGSVVVQAMKDAFNAIKDVRKNLGTLASAFKAAARGDFSGAADIVKNAFTSAFTATSSAAQMSSLVADDLAAQLGASAEAGKAAIDDAFASIHADITSIQEPAQKTTGAVSDLAEVIEEEGKAAKENNDANEKIADTIDKIGKSIQALKTNYEDVLEDFRGRIKKAKEEWQDFRKAVKAMRAEIRGVKDEFNAAKKDLKFELAKNIAQELIESEDRIKDYNKQIASITESSEKEIAAMRAELASGPFTEYETKQHLEKITAIYADAADDILAINEQLAEDIEGINEDTADEIARINNSINDYATQAEKDEAAQKIAALEASQAEKAAKLEEDAQKEIDTINSNAEKEVQALEDAKTEKIRIFNETLEEKIAASEAATAEEIANIQEQIDTENAFLEAHKGDYKRFANAITEARRVGGLDSIQVLREQFQAEKAELKQNKKDQIAEIKSDFAKQHELRQENFKSIKKMMKRERKAHNKHLDKMRERRKEFLQAIKDDFSELVELLETVTGGVVTAKTGSTDSGIARKDGGGGSAVVSIGNVTLNNQEDIDAFANSIALIFRTAS